MFGEQDKNSTFELIVGMDIEILVEARRGSTKSAENEHNKVLKWRR